jgi:hypothetical protein
MVQSPILSVMSSLPTGRRIGAWNSSNRENIERMSSDTRDTKSQPRKTWETGVRNGHSGAFVCRAGGCDGAKRARIASGSRPAQGRAGFRLSRSVRPPSRKHSERVGPRGWGVKACACPSRWKPSAFGTHRLLRFASDPRKEREPRAVETIGGLSRFPSACALAGAGPRRARTPWSSPG